MGFCIAVVLLEQLKNASNHSSVAGTGTEMALTATVKYISIYIYTKHIVASRHYATDIQHTDVPIQHHNPWDR